MPELISYSDGRVIMPSSYVFCMLVDYVHEDHQIVEFCQ